MLVRVYPESIDRAIADIEAQIECLASGDVDRRIFDSSKEMVRNQLLSIADNGQLLLFKRNNITSGRNMDVGFIETARRSHPRRR